MKVSIITVVYNGEKFIKDCIQSVLAQDYPYIEYIVIDGASTDQTLQIVNQYHNQISHLLSEKDKGIYDAINKGLALATGDVIGLLNADDTLASETIITEIVAFLKQTGADGLYGNLNYVDGQNTQHIIRKWKAKQHTANDFNLGWMPAHPTLYLRRALFSQFGNYSLAYGTAGDYELMLRFLFGHKARALYFDRLIVNMGVGGISNATLKQRYLAFKNDYKAAKNNHIWLPFLAVSLKKISKIKQFFHNN